MKNGETPGLLMWALGGLVRLLRQRQFTISSVSEAVFENLKLESNPTAQFLKEHVRLDHSGSVECAFLFERYTEWIQARRQLPLGDSSFGKEVKRAFNIIRKKLTKMGKRDWNYIGLSYTTTSEVDDEPEEPRIEELF
jgi:phage/plasmid-associated DNA primase